MPSEVDDRYLRYVVARLAPYRNVWWSMANEFDLMEAKTMQDWDRFFMIVQENDPYQHLRSVHNCRGSTITANPGSRTAASSAMIWSKSVNGASSTANPLWWMNVPMRAIFPTTGAILRQKK